SRDGKRIAYTQQLTTVNIHKIAFDPVKENVASQPQPITQGSRQARNAQLSPDGEWLTFWDGGKQEDIFIIKTDGTELRQLTNDVYKTGFHAGHRTERASLFTPIAPTKWTSG